MMNQPTILQNLHVSHFHVGAIVIMGDEQWKVMKTSPADYKNPMSDVVSMRPYNEVARSRNISMAIDFSIGFLTSEGAVVAR